MAEGTRLALAILILFVAMVAFFFAFHPGGVVGVSDPDTMLQWLTSQFQATASGTPMGTAGAATSPNTSVPSTNLTNVPGTNLGP